MKQVAGYIQRKTMLYETGVEYGDYTMNHVLGCAHGCLYPCYAYLQKKRFGQVKDYEQWLKPYRFATDPFMYEYDEIATMSMNAIELLNASNIRCTVLTKGILPAALSDRNRFPADNEYGITLITLDEEYREKKEPYAATCQQRLDALRVLHNAGRRTWVSIEPYPTPNLIKQDLGELLEEVSFVDRIIFGRTNYCKEITKEYPEHRQFYNEKAQEVIDFCEKRGIAYYIKEKTVTR